MDNLNNLYNFKKPIRHFFNLDAMCFYSSEEVEFNKLCWTIEKLTDIFSNVLSTYELDANHDKTLVYDFEEYTQVNNLEKQWNRINNL